MGNSINIPDYFEIKEVSDLDTFFDKLKSEVDLGNLEQFWDRTNTFATPERIEDIGNDVIYPDYIELYFRSSQTGKKYKLAVETYHGSGGEWSLIE